MVDWSFDFHAHSPEIFLAASVGVPAAGFALGYGAGKVFDLFAPYVIGGFKSATEAAQDKLAHASHVLAIATMTIMATHTPEAIKAMPHGVLEAKLRHEVKNLDPKVDFSHVNFSSYTTQIKMAYTNVSPKT